MTGEPLTKLEKQHLRENGDTIARFKAVTFPYQQKLRVIGGSEPCYTCKSIARKLGLLEGDNQ